MSFQLASFCPLVRRAVVVHVTKHQAVLSTVDDDANIPIDPHRPEVGIFGLGHSVVTQPRLVGVGL